jgi:hypothetical protein
MIGWAGSALAAPAEAETAVVARLYKDFAWQAIAGQTQLFGEDLAHQGKATLEKYFAPGLADLFVKDAACQVKYQGICNLGFDVLFDTQDPRVSDLEITAVGPGTVAVVFADPASGEKTQIEFKVTKVAGIWKIIDVIYRQPKTTSLKQVLSQKIP